MTTTPGTVPHTLGLIRDEVGAMYFERATAIEAAMVTILAKQNAFFIGLPGTGKSEMSREVLSRIVGDPVWEPATMPVVTDRTYAPLAVMLYDKQLHAFTSPEEVFGAVDVPALKNTGDYHRKVDGFMPCARYVHCDEMGKANPSLLGGFLTITNERVYHNNARVMITPNMSTFACSNEMLTEDDSNAAMWDRMHVRVLVDYIQEPANFAKLLQLGTGPAPSTRTTIDFPDLLHAINVDVPAVHVGQDTIDALLQLRDALRASGLRPSDRRFRSTVRLMQASAYLNGRSQCNEDDLAVARFVFWDSPEQITQVERLVLGLSNPTNEEALKILDQIEQLAQGVAERQGKASAEKSAYATECNGKLKVKTAELLKLKQKALAAGRSTTKIDEVEARMGAIKRTIYVDLLGMDPALVRA